jgi:hypothetical protein
MAALLVGAVPSGTTPSLFCALSLALSHRESLLPGVVCDAA